VSQYHDFADFRSSYGMGAPSSDVLSEVLTLIRLRGELVYTAELSAPWGIRYSAGPSHFHFVEEGSFWLTAEGIEPLFLKRGDLVLLPHGHGHSITDHPSTIPVSIERLGARSFQRDELHLRIGGGGAKAAFVGGLFGFEGSLRPAIIAALPMVIHIPAVDADAPRWLSAIVHFLVDEAHQSHPGSSLMISRLIDLLVIRSLRSWAASHTARGGWLGGVAEERIGRALSAMHADPLRRWSVMELAEIALMSRTVFAQRFAATVGEPPLRYLTRWRLTIAADLMRSGRMKVTEAAQHAGYASDAAFSRAFKAHFGQAPSALKDLPN
jgi:AraC-like DNA-binding protein